MTTLTDPEATSFCGTAVRVDEDRVGYANVAGRVSYELADPVAVAGPWRRQVRQLRMTAP